MTSRRRTTVGCLALALVLGNGCVATRLSRPAYHGTVVDAATRAPLSEVKVAWDRLRLTTDNRGTFSVPAATYREVTFPGNEAPALFFTFTLRKPGYCDRTVKYVDPRGGGGSPTHTWKQTLAMTPETSGPCPNQAE